MDLGYFPMEGVGQDIEKDKYNTMTHFEFPKHRLLNLLMWLLSIKYQPLNKKIT